MLPLLEFLITQYTVPTVIIGIIVIIVIIKEIYKFYNWVKTTIVEPIR
jgi:hypothetical protein